MKVVFILVSILFSLASVAEEKVAVESVKGLVSYGGTYLKPGQKIQLGKTIDSSGKSVIVLKYPNGRKIQLRGARAKLKKMDSEDSQIELLSGKLFGWFKKDRNRAKKPFRIRTRGVVAGVRGTKFMIEEQSEKTYLCVCEGEVAIKKGDQEVALKRGYDLWDKIGATQLKSPQFAQERMLEMVAESVEDMGGKTKAYWREEGWKKSK